MPQDAIDGHQEKNRLAIVPGKDVCVHFLSIINFNPEWQAGTDDLGDFVHTLLYQEIGTSRENRISSQKIPTNQLLTSSDMWFPSVYSTFRTLFHQRGI